MNPQAFLTSSFGDRMRMRIPSRKGEDSFFRELETRLRQNDAIYEVSANPLTGSVLIRHGLDLEELAAFGLENGLFVLRNLRDRERPLLDLADQRVGDLDERIAILSRGNLDLDQLLFAGVLGLAAIQFIRGHWLGPATGYLVDAAAILSLHRNRNKKDET